MAIATTVLACVVTVHPITMEKIILGESGGDPYAVHVNHYTGPQPHPGSKDEAVEIAERFITAGFSVDLGESQINSRNLGALGYSLADAFDDCKNVAGGGMILTAFYRKAVERYGEGETALEAAISAYNTGSFFAGYARGYVSHILGIPALPGVVVAKEATKAAAPPDPYTASTEVYSRVSDNVSIQ